PQLRPGGGVLRPVRRDRLRRRQHPPRVHPPGSRRERALVSILDTLAWMAFDRDAPGPSVARSVGAGAIVCAVLLEAGLHVAAPTVGQVAHQALLQATHAPVSGPIERATEVGR